MNQATLFDPDPAQDAEPARVAEQGRTSTRRRLVVEADGGSRGNPGPAGYGALVRDGDLVLAERAEFLGKASNNVAEYSGLIAGLTAARQIDPTALVEVRMDSKLVVEQMSGRWKIKHEDMRRLAGDARAAFRPDQVTYTWIPRAQNSDADALANQVMDSGGQVSNDYPDDDGGVPGGPGEVVDPRQGADDAPDPLDEAPVPDVDADAPSMSESGVLTLVLVSPGMTPRSAVEVAAVPDLQAELTEDGIELAAGAAALVDSIGAELWPHLPAPSVLLSSPAVRAQQTAELISESTGLGAPTVDRDFVRGTPEETHSRVAKRVGAALTRLSGKYPGRTVVVAAHADIIATVAGIVADLPMSSWHALRIAPGTVSVVRYWDGGGEVHVLGCPAQLGGSTG